MFVSKKKYNETLNELWDTEDELQAYMIANDKLEKTLQYIIEQETPAANATVSRIVNAAKNALGEV